MYSGWILVVALFVLNFSKGGYKYYKETSHGVYELNHVAGQKSDSVAPNYGLMYLLHKK